MIFNFQFSQIQNYFFLLGRLGEKEDTQSCSKSIILHFEFCILNFICIFAGRSGVKATRKRELNY